MLKFFKNASGEWQWHVTGKNGKVTADSAESYKNKGDCVHGALVTFRVLLQSAASGQLSGE